MMLFIRAYYSNWTATIDGKPTTLYPANFAFRAVLVPPGEHRVASAARKITIKRNAINLSGHFETLLRVP